MTGLAVILLVVIMTIMILERRKVTSGHHRDDVALKTSDAMERGSETDRVSESPASADSVPQTASAGAITTSSSGIESEFTQSEDELYQNAYSTRPGNRPSIRPPLPPPPVFKLRAILNNSQITNSDNAGSTLKSGEKIPDVVPSTEQSAALDDPSTSSKVSLNQHRKTLTSAEHAAPSGEESEGEVMPHDAAEDTQTCYSDMATSRESLSTYVHYSTIDSRIYDDPCPVTEPGDERLVAPPVRPRVTQSKVGLPIEVFPANGNKFKWHKRLSDKLRKPSIKVKPKWIKRLPSTSRQSCEKDRGLGTPHVPYVPKSPLKDEASNVKSTPATDAKVTSKSGALTKPDLKPKPRLSLNNISWPILKINLNGKSAQAQAIASKPGTICTYNGQGQQVKANVQGQGEVKGSRPSASKESSEDDDYDDVIIVDNELYETQRFQSQRFKRLP